MYSLLCWPHPVDGAIHRGSPSHRDFHDAAANEVLLEKYGYPACFRVGALVDSSLPVSTSPRRSAALAVVASFR